MPKDITVIGWQDPADATARVGEALGGAGINIEGTFGSARLGEIHVLVEDPARARRALEQAGLQVGEERDVILRSMKVANRPGAWGRLVRRLADAQINIEFHYMATDTRVVVGVDDYDRAIVAMQALGG